jgi:hypothetical protein
MDTSRTGDHGPGPPTTTSSSSQSSSITSAPTSTDFKAQSKMHKETQYSLMNSDRLFQSKWIRNLGSSQNNPRKTQLYSLNIFLRPNNPKQIIQLLRLLHRKRHLFKSKIQANCRLSHYSNIKGYKVINDIPN